jgi:hypothetical protein
MAEEDINRQISYNTELKAFAEKFAELIVTECAVLINDERRAFNPTEWDQGADWGHKNAVDAITKHFGVKE